jgi:hypothetical protein
MKQICLYLPVSIPDYAMSREEEQAATLCQKSFSIMNSFTLLQETVHAITGKFKGEQCPVIA